MPDDWRKIVEETPTPSLPDNWEGKLWAAYHSRNQQRHLPLPRLAVLAFVLLLLGNILMLFSQENHVTGQTSGNIQQYRNIAEQLLIRNT